METRIQKAEIDWQIADLLKRAAWGEHFEIMDGDRVVARLLPPEGTPVYTNWRAIAHEGHKY